MVDLVGIEPTTSSMPWERARVASHANVFKLSYLRIG